MVDPAEVEDFPFEPGLPAKSLQPRTRDELVQLLIQVQFAADRLGTMARRALILAHAMVGEDHDEEARSRVLPWR